MRIAWVTKQAIKQFSDTFGSVFIASDSERNSQTLNSCGVVRLVEAMRYYKLRNSSAKRLCGCADYRPGYTRLHRRRTANGQRRIAERPPQFPVNRFLCFRPSRGAGDVAANASADQFQRERPVSLDDDVVALRTGLLFETNRCWAERVANHADRFA